MKRLILSVILIGGMTQSCSDVYKNKITIGKDSVEKDAIELSQNRFNAYWYNGEAEITSYKLNQSRYGEIHEGHSVLIYVTEQFLPKKQLKANKPSNTNVPVLKLNSTKKYLTGIYPYSIMSSVFSPINGGGHAVKSTFSYQEWCGQTYVQLNNRDKFEIESHSYFEGDGDKEMKLKKAYLENDIWTTIRISPNELPIGNHEMIPSLEFLTMQQKEIKSYAVITSQENKGGFSYYNIDYPELDRKLVIQYNSEFPFIIEGWEETFKSDFVRDGVELTSRAERLSTIKSDYWNKNKTSDRFIRNQLNL